MAGKPAPRRTGLPPILRWDASTGPKYASRLGADTTRAINEDVIGTPEMRAAEVARLRSQILRAVRKQRHIKPIEASLARVDRLKQLEKALVVMRSDLSAIAIAGILKGRSLFPDVQLGTLRKDILTIRKRLSQSTP